MEHYNSKTESKYKKVIDQLSKNNIIIKQDKKCGQLQKILPNILISVCPCQQQNNFQNKIMIQQVNWKVKCKEH